MMRMRMRAKMMMKGLKVKVGIAVDTVDTA
jgi:hypothetical protein